MVSRLWAVPVAYSPSAQQQRRVGLQRPLKALDGLPSCLSNAKAMAARLSLGSNGVGGVYPE